MKKHFFHSGMILLFGFGLSACNYEKVPVPPPSYANPPPSFNSNNTPPNLHPTLMLQKTTSTNKLNILSDS